MDDLHRYGLLSLVCIIVLALVVTYQDRDAPRGEPRAEFVPRDVDPTAYAKTVADGAALEAAGLALPTPGAEREHARPANEAPVTAAPAGPGTYTVKSGDTLTKIAAAHLGEGKRWPEILAANPAVDARSLRLGTVLRLPSRSAGANALAADVAPVAPLPVAAKPKPPSKTPPNSSAPRRHVVGKGETLSSLARRYYDDAMKWRKIYDANRSVVKNPKVLPAGVELTIP
jgi:nucleoid-associated protein YgaU